jgi:CubicO group peptidase (beta-lactamase class C family)
VADELADRLDAYAETVLATGAASSMAVAVTDGERTLASRTYGVPAGTMFQFGSIGKSFTAIVALQLAERGLLDLHAPVTDVLPWFAVGGTTAPITLHHLLTHSSGLIQGAEIATGSNYDVVALADTAVGFAPGEHLWYSNVGYRVIGWMLERVSGHGYPRLVRERIRPRLAQATVPAFDDRPWRPEHGLVPATWIDSAEADGCICASGGDLAIYLRALMTRDERLLSAESWAAMLAPHVEDDQEGDRGHYGYGIAIGPRDCGHVGGMIGTGSLMWPHTAGLAPWRWPAGTWAARRWPGPRWRWPAAASPSRSRWSWRSRWRTTAPAPISGGRSSATTVRTTPG